MKEVALIHSEGILAGEMKHGPLALVDEHMPILVVATKDDMYQKMHSVIQQLLARKARLIILCNEGDELMEQYATRPDCQLIEVCSWGGTGTGGFRWVMCFGLQRCMDAICTGRELVLD